ncbi:protein sprint isoform X7 [Bradysia coprophila]|uniref:protein sprint isoform X7 n=1 Tax=Bradysia coprophila TaxID=38358 RepID=UPI00187DD7FD|nr:protein sprint isoform X7 [Bradysia coprophila]
MKWFKKWLQERNANRSNSDSIQNGNKSKNSTSSEQSVDDTGVKLSRESICKSSEKTVRPSSSDCPSSSSSAATKTGPISVQSTIHPSSQTSIHSTPIARRIRQQVKSLESLISDSVTSDHSINVEHDECEHGATGSAPEVVDPDDFFENPDDIRHPRNKQNNSGPGESVAAYALTLAADTSSTFSRNIENFIACTKESREVAPQVVMRNMRQFMSGMKNYLVKHGEGNFQQEVFRARSLLKADEFLNLDTILEGVMHQLVVLPLREYLYGLFVDFYTGTSDIQLLVENVKYASARSAADFGIRSTVTPPSSAAMQQISLLILRLQEAELPLEKLEYLLAVVSAIFEASKHPRGQPLGADDFLPILVFIVAKCGFIGAEIEAEFMWCLLQQSLLNGEAGYYLTALCSAVHVLKTFMASEMDGTGSLDIRSSSQPACSSVLRVIIPDEYNGSLQTRTLPVRPHTTTREVCRTIAHKARITNPQDYGLFKLVDGEETLLMDNDCPQEARLAARGKHCMLAYKRIDAKIAWPTMTSN